MIVGILHVLYSVLNAKSTHIKITCVAVVGFVRMAEAECKRQIKIKTNVLSRCACGTWRTNRMRTVCSHPRECMSRTMKEYAMYHEEQAQQEAKIEKMKLDSTKDEYDVRKQVGRGPAVVPAANWCSFKPARPRCSWWAGGGARRDSHDDP
jgi:hypothetical protein